MAGGKFVGWLVDMIPGVFKKLKIRRRANEVDEIDEAMATGDTELINRKLRDAVKKYKRNSKGNS